MARARLALLVLPALAAAVGEWPDLPALINTADEAAYLSIMQPVLQAIKLSYTATYGSYRHSWDVNATLGSGWKRFPELDVDPQDGGFHGLVFFHEASGRCVLALRGTDLNASSPSGLADKCADRILWSNKTYESLPARCRVFPPSALDYLSAAANFTDRALAALPSTTAPLLVGHSLGAGLAVLVAADRAREQRWHPRALVLSAPTYDIALRERVGREPGQLDQSRLANIYNVYDPLCHKGNMTGGNAGAPICTFVPPEPAACVQCYGPGGKDGSEECTECFGQTHVLKNYIVDLGGNLVKPPPFRPRCPALHSSSDPILV